MNVTIRFFSFMKLGIQNIDMYNVFIAYDLEPGLETQVPVVFCWAELYELQFPLLNNGHNFCFL